MSKIRANGIHISYERCGVGPSLVLLHGYPLDHSIWDQVTKRLTSDFDVILPDLRGFGASDCTETQYSVMDMAADIAQLLDVLQIERAYIAGHSMGGYVALAFARQLSARSLGVGLIASQALADSPERKAGRYATARQVAEQGVEQIANSMAEKLTARADLIPPLKTLITTQRPSGIIGALKAMAERDDSSPALSSFHFPIVVIHGDADALIPIDRAREIKVLVPAAHLVELPGAGHMPMLENPQGTADALLQLKSNHD